MALHNKVDGEKFMKELTSLLNKYSIDNELNIPDFILALNVFNYLFQMKQMHDQYEAWRNQV